jgi:restriction system protein
MKVNKGLSRSEFLASKVLYAAMCALKLNNSELPARRVLEEVEKVVVFNEWERGVHQKTGNVRWRSVLHFYSIDCVKAGSSSRKTVSGI